RIDGEIDVAQRLDAEERLGDPAHLEDGLAHHTSPTCRRRHRISPASRLVPGARGRIKQKAAAQGNSSRELTNGRKRIYLFQTEPMFGRNAFSSPHRRAPSLCSVATASRRMSAPRPVQA